MSQRRDSLLRSIRDPDKLIYLVLLLMVLEWAEVFRELGIYVPPDDALGYMYSGLRFAETGMITMYNEYPTAMVMPGMSVLIGVLSLFFKGKAALTVAVRVLFGGAMCATAMYMYKSAKLLMPKGYALLCACAFASPHYAWIAHNVLTEAPYYLFSMINLYCMLRMGMTEERRYFTLFAVSFMLALMFRANILTTLPFSVLYVLVCAKRGGGGYREGGLRAGGSSCWRRWRRSSCRGR